MKKIWTSIILSIFALVLNVIFQIFVSRLHLIVWLDTIFVVALTFYSGLVPGLIVAAVYNPIMTLIFCALNNTEIFYFDFLYSICGMLIVTVTWIFSHKKKEFFFSRTVTVLYLVLIAFCSAFVSCFSASALDTFVRPLFSLQSPFNIIDGFSPVFKKFNYSAFLSFLLPRIPISVLDRLICTFSGYGLYRLLLKIQLSSSPAPVNLQEG